MRVSALIFPVLGAIALGSCATSSVSPSGFLTNYSQLGPDLTRYEAAAVYVHPTVDFNKYDSVIVDPVTVYPSNSQMSQEEQTELGAYLQRAFVKELGRHYKIVQNPGPSTMRLRTALAGVSGPSAETGLMAFVNTTQVEAELIDSSSNERLAAIADNSLANLDTNDSIKTVQDIKTLLDTTASTLASRLTDLRARILPATA
jgi:hypothetical protein